MADMESHSFKKLRKETESSIKLPEHPEDSSDSMFHANSRKTAPPHTKGLRYPASKEGFRT